jgi:hypothetical protein
MACPCVAVEAPVITSCDDQEITSSQLIELLGNLSLASASLGLFNDRKSSGMIEDLI